MTVHVSCWRPFINSLPVNHNYAVCWVWTLAKVKTGLLFMGSIITFSIFSQFEKDRAFRKREACYAVDLRVMVSIAGPGTIIIHRFIASDGLHRHMLHTGTPCENWTCFSLFLLSVRQEIVFHARQTCKEQTNTLSETTTPIDKSFMLFFF